MKYREADLDYIYIRTQKSDGSWGSLSLNELTDEQFVKWAEGRFGVKIKDDPDQVGKPWTPAQKVDFLNDMSRRLGGPAVVMIKRKARNEWDKNKKRT